MNYQRLLDSTEQVLILRHLGGKHSQKTHGRKSKGKDTKPSGKSKVSQGLNLLFFPEKGKVGTGSRAAIDAINSVHGTGDLPTIFLESDNSKDIRGGYTFHSDGKPVNIKISTQGNHPGMTTAHEIGHFLDHQGFGKKGVFSSDTDNYNLSDKKEKALAEKTNVLYAEMSNSKAINALKKDVPNKKIDFADPIFEERTLTYTADKEYINFLLEPREQFARAYSQYIVTKSNNPDMRNELDIMRKDRDAKNKIYYHEQWDDNDFKPIAKAFDDLFLDLGWVETG